MSEFLLILSCVICLLQLAIQCLAWAGLLLNQYHDREYQEEWPKVSVLIAARNEEQHIAACLQAVLALDYPAEKLEILVGDDASTDQTAQILEHISRQQPRVQVFRISQNLGKTQGKANVLAQLARQASGDFLFITDADILVNPRWIKAMLPHFEEKTGIVSGSTLGQGSGWLGRMQAMDWTYLMGLLQGMAQLGIPCTAVGNNMALRRQAYLDTGGYEAIDFSVTEDYKLYDAVRKQGWFSKNIMTRFSFHHSATLGTFGEILHQRKRWLSGGRELPLAWWFIFFVFGFSLYALLYLLYAKPIYALLFLSGKSLLDFLSIYTVQNGLGQKKSGFAILSFEAYLLLLQFSVALFYYLPFSFRWKGRQY